MGPAKAKRALIFTSIAFIIFITAFHFLRGNDLSEANQEVVAEIQDDKPRRGQRQQGQGRLEGRPNKPRQPGTAPRKFARPSGSPPRAQNPQKPVRKNEQARPRVQGRPREQSLPKAQIRPGGQHRHHHHHYRGKDRYKSDRRYDRYDYPSFSNYPYYNYNYPYFYNYTYPYYYNSEYPYYYRYPYYNYEGESTPYTIEAPIIIYYMDLNTPSYEYDSSDPYDNSLQYQNTPYNGGY